MKRLFSLLIFATALSALLLSCKKEDAQGGDAVYAIELNKTELLLTLDEKFTMEAKLASPEQSFVKWKSSDPAIVSVDEDSGELTVLVDEGEVTITADLYSKSPVVYKASATCAVSVETNYSLSLDFASLNMAQEATKTVTALPAPESGYGKIEWATTSSSIVQLSKTSGISTVLTAQKSNGTSKVTAKLYSRFDSTTPKATAVCDVEVKSFFVEELGLPSRVDLVMGTPQTLVPSIKPQEVVGTPVTYEVRSGSDYVSVSSEGKLTPKNASGTNYAVVRATAQDREKKYQDVKVYVAEKPVYPTGVSITGFVSETYVSQTFDPVLTFTPANTNQKIYTVKSSNTNVTVSKNSAGYHVYAKSSGTTTITVTYNTSETTTKTLTQTLTVFVGPPSIKWTNDQSTELKKGMIVGQTLTVTAKVSNMSNTGVTYSSSNTSVATVDASTGVITAKGRGSAYITATSKANSSLKVSTEFFTVYGVPTQVVCTAGDKDPIFLRYGNEPSSTTSMTFEVRDANGYRSRQDLLTVSVSSNLSGITKEVTSGSTSTTVKLTNTRTSATSTIAGSMYIRVTGYSSLTKIYDLYDAMYGSSDLKPFDAVQFWGDADGDYYAVSDGGYRGSGYFEHDGRITTDDDVLVVAVETLPSKTHLGSLEGLRHNASKERKHGFAIAKNNASNSIQWWTSTTTKNDDAVRYSSHYEWFWTHDAVFDWGDYTEPYENKWVGYAITTCEKTYNNRVSSSKYQVQPVKALTNMGSMLTKTTTHSGWYVPTSAEWYKMLTCMGTSFTPAETCAKINHYLLKMSGRTLKSTESYWSCQESKSYSGTNAVYMTTTTATASGTDVPTSQVELKTEYKAVRPFLAF